MRKIEIIIPKTFGIAESIFDLALLNIIPGAGCQKDCTR